MPYKLIIVDGKCWQKDCDAIDRTHMLRVLQAIKKLEKDPWDKNIQVKQLKNYELADYRLRIGNYRILFNKNDDVKTILLLRILHRSKLY